LLARQAFYWVDRFQAEKDLSREHGERFFLTSDNLHMNDTGHRCMAEQLARAIVGGILQARNRSSRLPAIYPYRFFAEEGGLIAYGIDGADQFRRAADYIARILQGAKPSELPIEQATKFELTINLKTAKTLGLTVPRILLAGADDVIELNGG
jgi:hypothetical protein